MQEYCDAKVTLQKFLNFMGKEINLLLCDFKIMFQLVLVKDPRRSFIFANMCKQY